MIFRKGFFFLLLALIAVLLVVAVFAGDPLFSAALRKYGPVATGQPMEFESASLSILKGQAQVSELQIGPAKKPLIQTKSVLLDAAATDLMAGRLFIEEASLLDMHLRLVIDKNGHFEFDPGPPPAGTNPDDDAPSTEGGAGETPAEDRDVVQVVSELWERYQTYKDYYDEYGGIFGGGADEEDVQESEERLALAGRPAYLDDVKNDASAEEEESFFQMKKAEIQNLSWETLDKRTGKPFLPELKQGTLSLLEIGTPDGKSTVHATADVAEGGHFLFSLQVPKNEGELTEVSAEVKSVPVDAVRAAINKSLPYRLKGGLLNMKADGLSFNDTSLNGVIHVELSGATFKPGPRSKKVLGVKPSEFCEIMNKALEKNTIAFDFTLGGTPTRPTFDIDNATDLNDLILGTLKDEAKERLNEEADKAKDKLQNKVNDKASDLLGDKAKGLLGDKKPDIGNLLGGKKDKKKKKDG